MHRCGADGEPAFVEVGAPTDDAMHAPRRGVLVEEMGQTYLAEPDADGGERSAGKPLASFDVAGAGNVTMAAGLRANAKALEHPPAPKVGAPVLDPTDERDVETELRRGYSGTARRKGRQQTNRAYCYRATSRLYGP